MADTENFDFLDNLTDDQIMQMFGDIVEGNEFSADGAVIARGGYCNGNFGWRYDGQWTTY